MATAQRQGVPLQPASPAHSPHTVPSTAGIDHVQPVADTATPLTTVITPADQHGDSNNGESEGDDERANDNGQAHAAQNRNPGGAAGEADDPLVPNRDEIGEDEWSRQLAYELLLNIGYTGDPGTDSKEFIDDFVHRPLPVGHQIQCKIIRQKTKRGTKPQFYFFAESSDGQPRIFLLSARKRRKARNSCYLISRSRSDLHQDSPDILGTVRSNFLGTEYVVYGPEPPPPSLSDLSPSPLTSPARPAGSDGGPPVEAGSESATSSVASSAPSPVQPPPAATAATTDSPLTLVPAAASMESPGNTSSSTQTTSTTTKDASERYREELCAVLYEPNIMGFKGPRKMAVIIPALSIDGVRRPYRPPQEDTSLVNMYRRCYDPSLLVLYNKSPQWNEESHSYVLNFNGRVTVASVKNFQLVNDLDMDYIILQFGRISQSVFTLDFQFPMTPLQAFGIALASFDPKLVCE
ncbi:hypothetical protein H4R33_005917 [Dimargaris cristalligena]|nr:hypothetical protein H4R33_005917 [Dimargaris cristalligena]